MNEIIFAGKHFLTHIVNRHAHSNWELVYCTSKAGKFIFEDTSIPYSEGDIVVIPPDLPHKNESIYGFTNIHLNIDNATLPFSSPVLVRDDGNKSLLHLFQDAYFLFTGDPDRRAALLNAYGGLIIRCITAYHTVRPKNKVAEQIIKSIVENYADANFDLETVLSQLPYCNDYLTKLMRNEVGMTPHQYLTNLRLQAASDLLCSVHSSITEVAHLCGFNNPLYFSRLFKKKYGVSPKEYYTEKVIKLTEGASADSQKIIPDP